MPNVMLNKENLEIIKHLEPCDYNEMWEFQKKRNHDVRQSGTKECIIFLQHKPVYTFGFHADENNLLICPEQLLTLGVPIFRIERGGDVTFHGPGQLVVYLIIDLNKRGYGIKEFVSRVEQSVIDTCSRFGIETGRREGAPGVWTAAEKSQKICAVGFKVKHGVTMHGLALNISPDLEYFNFINPCGFKSNSVTSMKKELKDVDIPSFGLVCDTLEKELLNRI